MSPVDLLCRAILAELAADPRPGGMSLPRLAKQLGLGVSVVMRALSLMGDAVIGGQSGPSWVQVLQTEDRWIAHLTAAGRAAAATLPLPADGGGGSAEPPPHEIPALTAAR